MRAKTLFAAALGACAIALPGAAGSAAAATTTFDFTGQVSSNQAFANGALIFDSNGVVSSPSGPVVRFHAFDYEPADGEFPGWGSADTPVILTEDGIGVWSRDEADGKTGHPLSEFTDSWQSNEVLVMELVTPAPWEPLAAAFSTFGNDNFEVQGHNGDGSFLNDMTAFANVANAAAVIGSSDTGGNPLSFATGGTPYDFLLFSTANTFSEVDGENTNDDRFKLASFTGSPQVVPVPAALPLLAGALAVFALIGGRRRLTGGV